MWKKRSDGKPRMLGRIEFCDSCGTVCDDECRSSAAREATRNKVALIAPVR